MILFVGLGNPTDKYENTRHNIGFKVIDSLVDDLKASSCTKSKFQGFLYQHRNILLLKPQTYMNLSGLSVQVVKNYFKPERIIVIHDDLDLCLGVVRFKIGGSSGGHNGIKSIDSYIGEDYERVRVGIGRPNGRNDMDVVSYVLSSFDKDQEPYLNKIIDHVTQACMELSKKPLDEVRKNFTSNKGLA